LFLEEVKRREIDGDAVSFDAAFLVDFVFIIGGGGRRRRISEFDLSLEDFLS
jgi:hypothetical protein